MRERSAPVPAPAWPVLPFLERHRRLIVLALVVIATVRIVATYTVFNHTSDEPSHIADGLEWLDKGTYRYEPQHPPLARAAVALGPYLLGARSRGQAHPDLMAAAAEGADLLGSGRQYGRRLSSARMGVLPFFWIACLVAYWWGKRYFGPAVAAIAVLLFSFLPPVLAHAGLATTDMALTAFLGAAFLAGLMWVEQPTIFHGALFGACTGIAVLSKFSTLAFLPATLGVTLAWYVGTERPTMATLVSAARRRIPSLGLAILVGALAIWAGYRFSFGNGLPAPEFFAGIRSVVAHNAAGHPSYLLGERSRTGFWAFYPVVLAVKTPLAFLILLGFGTVLAFRKQEGFQRSRVPLAFSAGILLVGVFTNINIGIRHVLPIYYGFSLVAAVAVARLLEPAPQPKWARAGIGVLLVWLAASSLWSHPDYLAYFNELAGSQPEKIAVDSDLDWGQDMKRLATRLREAGAREVTFDRFVYSDLERQLGFPPVRAMDFERPSPGWNAVSLTLWKQRRFGLLEEYPQIRLWPDRVKPGERVGKGIMLWYFRPR